MFGKKGGEAKPATTMVLPCKMSGSTGFQMGPAEINVRMMI